MQQDRNYRYAPTYSGGVSYGSRSGQERGDNASCGDDSYIADSRRRRSGNCSDNDGSYSGNRNRRSGNCSDNDSSYSGNRNRRSNNRRSQNGCCDENDSVYSGSRCCDDDSDYNELSDENYGCCGGDEEMVLAMAYVKNQPFRNVCTNGDGWHQGTIFNELNLPYGGKG